MNLKKIALIGILVVLVGITGLTLLQGMKSTLGTQTESQTEDEVVLEVPAQTSDQEVLISRVTMPSNGWVVARGIEDGKLGQVIEISPFLEKGEHRKITIPLGEFYNGEELIAVIYEDQDNDGIFNGLDLPKLDSNGLMIARRVKTGEEVEGLTEAGMSGMLHNMPGMAGMIQIRYTNDGFVPKNIEVPAGSLVEFINESDREMWVASDTHPTHERLATFDQFRSYPKGGVYRYVFDKPGIWPYHDHISPADEGIITVQQ